MSKKCTSTSASSSWCFDLCPLTASRWNSAAEQGSESEGGWAGRAEHRRPAGVRLCESSRGADLHSVRPSSTRPRSRRPAARSRCDQLHAAGRRRTQSVLHPRQQPWRRERLLQVGKHTPTVHEGIWLSIRIIDKQWQQLPLCVVSVVYLPPARVVGFSEVMDRSELSGIFLTSCVL